MIKINAFIKSNPEYMSGGLKAAYASMRTAHIEHLDFTSTPELRYLFCDKRIY